VLEAFRAHHIVIPFPQRDIRVLSWKTNLSGEIAPT
jgi:small-conductance mechanosensitive channel